MDGQWNENQEVETEIVTETVEQAYVEPPYVEPPYAEPQYENSPVPDTSKDSMCTAAFILGIIGFFINPFYAVSVLAIVFGAIGKDSASVNAEKAKIGMILGIIATVLQLILDLCLGGWGCCC